MKTEAKRLFDILNTIEGSGSFISSGVNNFVFPGMHIDEVGEVSFPLNELQAKKIIQIAELAPFGKGSKTVTDNSVRNSWEIDASQLSFNNPKWPIFLKKIVKKVREGLGVEHATVKASLYKLLIYEKGGFFLPHRDSEKEPGMFGTLVVCLPSKYKGGELVVRFEGEEEVLDFAPAAGNYSISHAAFYADCEHEIKPVKSGYRLCLVYNLVQDKSERKIASPKFQNQEGELVKLLEEWEEDAVEPKIVLLGHQYTPTNFSLETLKQEDLPRAETLVQAAEKAGYYAKLGLVTAYQMGDLDDGHDHYSRYRSEKVRDSSIGDVHEETISIENWAVSDIPSLGEWGLDEKEILFDFKLKDGKPIEEYEDDYTGNAGMTMEYWYHYGAVILWPKSKLMKVLNSKPVSVKLNWLEYFLKKWEDKQVRGHQKSMELLPLLAKHDFSEISRGKRGEPDFSPVATALAKLANPEFLKEQCSSLLSGIFEKLSVKDWNHLFKTYSAEFFESIYDKAMEAPNKSRLDHWLEILVSLSKSASPFFLQETRYLPSYLESAPLTQKQEFQPYYYGETAQDERKRIKNILKNAIHLSNFHSDDHEWVTAVHLRTVRNMTREFLYKNMAPVLLRKKLPDNPLSDALRATCIEDLRKRTARKPTPPADWSREVPVSKDYAYKQVWELLGLFMASSTMKVYKYSKAQSYRSTVADAIKLADVDLKMETIRKGSPHTLKITKTQATFDRALKTWKEDMELLSKFEVVV